MVDGVRHGARGEHGLKPDQGNVRGNEKDSGSKGDADRGLEMMALTAQHPGDHRTQQKAGGRQPRRQAQRGKGWSGEIEQVRHRERVASHIAMGEQRADVAAGRESARRPQAVSKRGRGNQPITASAAWAPVSHLLTGPGRFPRLPEQPAVSSSRGK